MGYGLIQRRWVVCLLLALCALTLPSIADHALQGFGTAVVVSSDGYLLTAAAPLQSSAGIIVTIAGKSYTATRITTFAQTEFALLKIDATNFTPITLAPAQRTTGQMQRCTLVDYSSELTSDAPQWVPAWYSMRPNNFGLGRVMQVNIQGLFNAGDPLVNDQGMLLGFVQQSQIAANGAITGQPASGLQPLLTEAGVTSLAGNATAPHLSDADLHQHLQPSIVQLRLLFSAQSAHRVNPQDGGELLKVPSGEFVQGNNGWYPDEHPQRTVTLGEFWISKYLVTVGQYKKFCAEMHRDLPQLPEPVIDLDPIVNISWQDACDYAKWCGGMLPTEAQWEKAARGVNGREFPWGNEPVEDGWPAMARAVNGTSGIPARQRGIQPVGSLPAYASPYGAQDMSGEVWEWCSDWYQANAYQTLPSKDPTGPASGVDRVIRGGSWFNPDPEDFRCAARAHLQPDNHNFFTGFRVAFPAFTQE